MEVVAENDEVKMSPEMRNILLEFTMNCLLEQPHCVQPYAAEYFQKKLDGCKTVIIRDYGEETGEEFLGEGMSDYELTKKSVIYAESYHPEQDTLGTAGLKKYPKTDEQRANVMKMAKECLLFRVLEKDDLEIVIDLMFPIAVKEGDEIIKEGDEGDNFYVIESGIYEVWRKENGVNVLVRSYMDEGSFGEIALLYNVPRTATVRAVSKGTLWGLNRLIFRKAVLQLAYQKRQSYEEFISNVMILQELTPYERMVLADALEPYYYNEGDVLIKQGDEADGMFFVENGSVQVVMESSGTAKSVKILRRGEYFGELALLTDHPRAATITALEPTKVAFLDKKAFERMLGPCMDILKRNIAIYEAEKKKLFGE